MISEEIRMNYLNKYHFIRIRNNKNLEVVFTDIGASIYTVHYQEKLITFTPLDDFNYFIHNGMHYGKTLGRTAGRIKNGVIIIDNKKYYLNKTGEHVLHGGKGFQFKKYKYVIEEDDNEYRVIFKRVSRHNEAHYPGNLKHRVIYHLSKNEDKLEIEFSAKTDKDTLCNISNHTYWNLECDMDQPITQEELFINADKYVVIDNDLILKEIANVTEQFDFRKPMKISKHLFDKELQEAFAAGYDHDFILNKEKGKPDVILYSSDKKMSIEMSSSYPVVHLFTSNCFEPRYKFHAIALEFQKEIFTPEKVILRKGEDYHHFIRYVFK